MAFVTSACASLRKDYPAGRAVISNVELQGVDSVDSDEILQGMATAESPRFLGIWDGVMFDYEVFDKTVLARDLERIERYYRRRGYYEAKVFVARVIRVDAHRVRVQIAVREGSPVLTERVTPRGLETLPIDVAAKAIARIKLKPGEVFDEDRFEQSKQAVSDTLADYGYAFVKVEGRVKVDLARHLAEVQLSVTAGPLSRYGPIEIKGLREIPEGPVRSTLLIERGDRYSRASLQEARQALLNLGVFGSVEIQEDQARPESAEVPVRVVVQEASLRTVRLGIGGTADVLRVAANLRAGWEDRNFLGGMRRFSIDTRPGVDFFPMRIDHIVSPTKLLPENRLRTELRQPSFIEGRTTGFIASEYNVIPLLYRLPEGVDPASEPIIGYNEVKASTGLERGFFNHHLFLIPSYNWEARFPFNYQGQKPPGLERVVVSYPEMLVNLDFRDDPIEPHQGFFLTNSFQVAGFVFGGSVSDVRESPEARIYVPLSKPVTLAVRTGFGFLFPHDYGQTLHQPLPQTGQIPPDVVRDQHKLLFRAFYSGGPNSNRGYAYQGVGPQGPVGFLVPRGINCNPTPPAVLTPKEQDACTRPLGGVTRWEASLEVRFPISGPLRGSLFADASDVTVDVGEIRITVPHLSVGPGLRYVTPVGPLRLDVGWRVPGAQKLGTRGDIPEDEGERTHIFRLPLAIHIAIGEAF
ncbi:MAG TPA: POTRA domain-containing protein [Polyangiaceae bacterium]